MGGLQSKTANNQWTESIKLLGLLVDRLISDTLKSIEAIQVWNYLLINKLTDQPINLFLLTLMTILSQSFLTLMRRNFMTLSFFTTRHTQIFF